MVDIEEYINEKYGQDSYDDQTQEVIDSWIASEIADGNLVCIDGDYWLPEDGIDEYTMHKMYDHFIDECYPEEIQIGWVNYRGAARLLKEVDEVSYRIGFNEFAEERCAYHSGLDMYFPKEDYS